MSTVGDIMSTVGISWVPWGLSWVPWGISWCTWGISWVPWGYSVPWGIPSFEIWVPWGDIMSTVGVFSTVGYSNNKRFFPHGTQDNPHGTQDIPHIYHDIPTVLNTPTVLKISPTVLMISPTVLMISPTVLHTHYRGVVINKRPLRGLKRAFLLLNNEYVWRNITVKCFVGKWLVAQKSY